MRVSAAHMAGSGDEKLEAAQRKGTPQELHVWPQGFSTLLQILTPNLLSS